MDKKLMIRFLIRETIKVQNGKRHNHRLWDAIRKAHRDVMTGARQNNFPNYVEKNKANRNQSLEYLYNLIANETGPLCSKNLIKKLQEKDKTIEFTALQKLVNMTLKYLILLNELDDTAPAFNICEEKCDCPIDSIILQNLFKINGISHECWTKMKEPEYIQVQREIKNYLEETYPQEQHGNIWFDFLKWNAD